MAHAAESTHYYTRDGAPAYTVKAKAGHDRPTTLADARKMSLVPSVTTIIKCAAAPGLEIWKQNQVLLAAMTLPKRQDEPEVDYLKRIMEDSREQARKAAERGTAIHAAIQDAYQGGDPLELWEFARGATEAVNAWLPGRCWIAERSFACSLGFGGKSDLFCSEAVIDFKTKEFDEAQAKDLKAWPEHGMQLGAYRHGLGAPKAKGAIVFVSTTVPGLAKLIELPEEELAKGWTCFYSLLHFWQAKSAYRSSFERMAA